MKKSDWMVHEYDREHGKLALYNPYTRQLEVIGIAEVQTFEVGSMPRRRRKAVEEPEDDRQQVLETSSGLDAEQFVSTQSGAPGVVA